MLFKTFRIIYLLVILLFSVPALFADSNLDLAKKYQKAKDYNQSLIYELKSFEAHPQSGFRAGRVAQNYYVYQREILKAVSYYRKAEELGFKSDWLNKQYMGASVWAGFYYMGEKNWDQAIFHFGKAKRINEENSFGKTDIPVFYELAVKRKALGTIHPSYKHRVKLLMIETTNALPKGVGKPIKGRLTEKQKRLTMLAVKGMISFWEGMSDGNLSVNLEVLEWEGPLTSIMKHHTNQHTKKTTMWVVDSKDLSKKANSIFDATLPVTDTYLMIWSAGRHNISNAGAAYYLDRQGKKRWRGYAQIPAERIEINGYFMVMHEMFHVLENIGEIKPRHGFRKPFRHHFSEWKGNDEFDYYRWHFQKTLAKLPEGWKSVTFLKHDNVN
jgi:tetratricopeptide (TPR) repeat protein